MATVKHAAYYTNVFNQWGKTLGPKPTEAQMALAHVFGRPGKQSLVVAMALRDTGVTRVQMLAAAGLFDGRPTPQLNHMKALVASKLLTRDTSVPGYKMVKGPDADKFIALHGAKAASAEPAKPAPKAAKPRRAKPAKPQAEPAPAAADLPPTEAPAPQAEAQA